MRSIFIRNSDLQGNQKIIQIEENTTFIEFNKILEDLEDLEDLEEYKISFFIKYSGKLYIPFLQNASNQKGIYLDPFNNTIEIIPRVVGGYFGILDDIKGAFEGLIKQMIEPLISPIVTIGEVIMQIVNIIVFLLQLVIWLIQFFIWFLIDFCNPINLAADFIGGIAKITKLFFAVITDAITGVLKYTFNKLLEPIFSGFWGWDNVLDDKQKAEIYKAAMKQQKNPNGLVKSQCHGPGVKCYRTPDGQVPFTVVLATILLPPMGLFMEFGLTSWINIVICGILTLMYYIPGLLYALILIYS